MEEMEGLKKRFLELRKLGSGSHSSLSSIHHTTSVETGGSGANGHVSSKVVLIIIGVFVAIFAATLVLYCLVHHHGYKKGAFPVFLLLSTNPPCLSVIPHFL
jgi:hypothetical protein